MPTFRYSVFRFPFSVFKLLFLAVINLSLFTFNFQLANAQTPLEKAEGDYTFQFTKYRELQNKYINARSSFLAFQTTVAKNDAYLATKDYLIQIDNLFKTYLLLVNENGNRLNWQNATMEKNNTDEIINNEFTFFDDHQRKVADAKTLEQLTDLASDLRIYNEKQFSQKINKVLAIFEVVETQSATTDFTRLTQEINEIIKSKIENNQNQSIFANWQSEITDIEIKTQNSLAKANELLNQTKKQTASDIELKNISKFTQLVKTELLRSKALFVEVTRIL